MKNTEWWMYKSLSIAIEVREPLVLKTDRLVRMQNCFPSLSQSTVPLYSWKAIEILSFHLTNDLPRASNMEQNGISAFLNNFRTTDMKAVSWGFFLGGGLGGSTTCRGLRGPECKSIRSVKIRGRYAKTETGGSVGVLVWHFYGHGVDPNNWRKTT